MNIFRTKNNTNIYGVNSQSAIGYYFSANGAEAVIDAPCQLSNSAVYILGTIHKVHLYYRNVKTSTINLINRTIEAILPNKYKKLETSQLLKILVDKLYTKIAEKEIDSSMERIRLLLGFAPEDYELKKLGNNLIAYCDTDEKKIVINPDITKYDRNVIDYIVLHEFCHLKYKIHTKNFWKMIAKYMPDYKKYEAILKDFSF